ncbi:fungal hydrophobin-domain-containing protein [Gautieria morchelliformis]|nr:fungal hydrophobin-domain-containing protein [Gautieria morchelliformis]
MMFFKAAVVSTLAILATANPTTTVTAKPPGPTVTTVSQCNTGGAQCCSTVGAANSLPGVAVILGLLGIVLQDASVVVGLSCVPIVGNVCTQQPVCCTDNDFNGLINIGCSPITL